jgi:hypothetical protein
MGNAPTLKLQRTRMAMGSWQSTARRAVIPLRRCEKIRKNT